MTRGIRSAEPPGNSTPSRVRRALLDRLELRVGVPQLVDDLRDHRVVDRPDLRREPEVLVIAELHLGPDLDHGLEEQRLPLLGLGDLDLGAGQRDDVLVLDRLAEGILHQMVDRIVENGRRPENPLEHEARGLARPEPRHANLAREAADRLVHCPAQAFGWQLELELEA
jgi:hypothetical protein